MPAFADIEIDGEARTAIRFTVLIIETQEEPLEAQGRSAG